MPKVQLYISKSYNGFKNLVNFNPDEDVRRHAVDFRNALDNVEYDTSRVNIFYLLAYRGQGVMITLIRTIPDRHGDHLAATVFVPDGLVVEPQQLTGLLEELARRIEAPAMDSNDIAALRNLFATDYPAAAATPAKVESEGRSYACAVMGGEAPTLLEYARTGFYTPSFGEYAGVLLVPPHVRFSAPDATPSRLPELVTLQPPQKNSNGFVPHIWRRVFNVPYLVPKGIPLEIVWRRGGFENVVQTVVPESENTEVPAADTGKAVKTITPASFYVTAQHNQEAVPDASVIVNGCQITGPVSFTLAELENAQVEISAKGFFTFSGKIDLASTMQALVQIKELRKIYRFDIPVITPEPEESVHFTIQSKKELDKCPVEGYAIAGDSLREGASRSNSLVYVGGRSRKGIFLFAAIAVVGIVLGFIAGRLSSGSCGDSGIETEPPVELAAGQDITQQPMQTADGTQQAPTTVQAVSTTPQPATASPDYAAAVAYMDANRVWDADSLENIPGMQGFFDDLNNYRFDRIKNHWAPLLDNSRSFAAVLRAVEGAASKRNPATEPHTPTYNNQGDKHINWRGYTYWIDP